MHTRQVKGFPALGASVCLIKKAFNWKMLAVLMITAASFNLSSCTAFDGGGQITPQDQVDDEYGPGCKLINGVIICP